MEKLRKNSVGIAIILLASLTGPVGGMALANTSSRDSPYLNKKANAPSHAISAQAKQILAQYNFVVVPSKEFKDVAEVYEDCKRKGIPIFLTTDAILHTTHILLDYTWRIVEIERLRPSLIELTQTLLEKSLHQCKEVKYPNIKEAALKDTMFFPVALKLLDNSKPIPDLIHFSKPIMDEIASATDSKMMAISDVHTDANTGRVLKEAIGYPFIIYIVAPVEGKLTLTRRAVFFYYEFVQPTDERLADEEWQKILETDREPALPEWRGLLGISQV